MSALFKEAKLTDFNNQKGCDITIESEGNLTVFNVWCDAIETNKSTIRVNQNNDGELLVVSVDEADYKLPSVTYSDDKSYCYVTFNNYSVHIKLDDEGVVFDVWDSTDDENGSVDTTYLFHGELEAKEAEQNHISIYGFETESDLENNKETHIDSITQDGDWEECALSIIKDNKDNYHHITVESDDGKPLPSFQ